ncbi:MAG: M42 family metallopeptidase [Euryarchaeota archaeon]|nr:M42 family metallopeptidase [Euryarchaeota archaeon]
MAEKIARGGGKSNVPDELRALVMLPGVTGYEGAVRDFLRAEAAKLAKVRVDRMGNLFAQVGDGNPRVGLVAHMDEVGLIVTNIDENGTLKFRKMGGIDDRTLVGRVVRIHTKDSVVNGVLGLKALHLTIDRDEGAKTTAWERLCIDVGARSRREAERMGIRMLDPVTIDKGFEIINGGYVCSHGLDNRIGCWAALQALRGLAKSRPKGTFYVVWTVQEEIGLRGAVVVSRTLPLDYVIAVDTYTTTDAPGYDKFYAPVMLGKGPVLRMVDTRALASPEMRRIIENAAKRARIPLQIGVTGGSTDGAALQEAGVSSAPIGIPMRYTHSPTEMVHIRDVLNLPKLLEASLREISRE